MNRRYAHTIDGHIDGHLRRVEPIPSSPVEATVADQSAIRPPRWGVLALFAFVGLVVCSNAASAVWARWVNTNPEGLLMLSSRNRYLALTLAAGIPIVAYVVIATLRLTAAFVVCHLIGRAYRGQALNWFTRYLGVTPESLEAFQRGFDRAQLVLIPFFAGSNIVAVISGVHRTPPAKLAVLLAVGIAGRLVLMWWLARTFEEQLVDFLGWLQRYQWWAVGISVVIVVLVNMRNFRRGAAR
jgi:hypothetical protein